MSKPKYYAVTGRGFFPLDMIRYDCASALNEVEQEKIDARTYHGDSPDDWSAQYAGIRDLTTICLKSHQIHAPCEGRWNSFGWVVTQVVFSEEGYRGMSPGEQFLVDKGEGRKV